MLQAQSEPVKAHLQSPTEERSDPLCCSPLAVLVATEMPAGGDNA